MRYDLHNSDFRNHIDEAPKGKTVFLSDRIGDAYSCPCIYIGDKTDKEIKKFLSDYAKDVTVFDCHMRFGSIAVICKDLGLNYIGCEKDEKLYEIAKKRVYEVSK